MTDLPAPRCPWCAQADLVADGADLYCPRDECEFYEQAKRTEIVVRGVNQPTYEAVVDALDEAGVNTEVVRRD